MSLLVRKERILGCLQEGHGHEDVASVLLKIKGSFIFFAHLWFFLVGSDEIRKRGAEMRDGDRRSERE
jgi:hypothetical protein